MLKRWNLKCKTWMTIETYWACWRHGTILGLRNDQVLWLEVAAFISNDSSQRRLSFTIFILRWSKMVFRLHSTAGQYLLKCIIMYLVPRAKLGEAKCIKMHQMKAQRMHYDPSYLMRSSEFFSILKLLEYVPLCGSLGHAAQTGVLWALYGALQCCRKFSVKSGCFCCGASNSIFSIQTNFVQARVHDPAVGLLCSWY